MDLDKNSYPDLAVGSLSDSVFVFRWENWCVFISHDVSDPVTVRKLLTEFCLLRARPVINIKKEIEFSPKKIDLTKKNCGNAFWYVGQLFLPI